MEEVISNANKFCKNFTKSDHVIIFAGIMDTIRGRKIEQIKLDKWCKDLSYTNVTFISATYCKNRRILNEFIYDYNDKLFKLSQNFDFINYVETNAILNERQMVNTKPLLTYSSKKAIFEYVNSTIVTNKFVNEQNLVFINCVDTFDLPIEKTNKNTDGNERIKMKVLRSAITTPNSREVLKAADQENNEKQKSGQLETFASKKKLGQKPDKCNQDETCAGVDLSVSESVENDSENEESDRVGNVCSVNSEKNSNRNVNFLVNGLVSLPV